jgi:hypothetical protein
MDARSAEGEQRSVIFNLMLYGSVPRAHGEKPSLARLIYLHLTRVCSRIDQPGPPVMNASEIAPVPTHRCQFIGLDEN